MPSETNVLVKLPCKQELEFFFFLSSDEETDKVESISIKLQNSLLKPILLFLSFILPSTDRFK